MFKSTIWILYLNYYYTLVRAASGYFTLHIMHEILHTSHMTHKVSFYTLEYFFFSSLFILKLFCIMWPKIHLICSTYPLSYRYMVIVALGWTLNMSLVMLWNRLLPIVLAFCIIIVHHWNYSLFLLCHSKWHRNRRYQLKSRNNNNGIDILVKGSNIIVSNLSIRPFQKKWTKTFLA